MFNKIVKSYLKNYGRSVILCFHSIGSSGFDKDKFVDLIEFLKSAGYTFPDPDTILLDKKDKRVYITFDDGYKDNLDIVENYLSLAGIKPIVFVVTNLLQGGIEVKSDNGLKNIPHMTVEEAISYKDIIHFGFHTHNHNSMINMSKNELRENFKSGMCIFKKLNTESNKNYFAYPFGYLPKDQCIADQILNEFEFDAAFTTRWGSINKQKYNINRVVIGDKDSLLKTLIKISGLMDVYAHIRWR